MFDVTHRFYGSELPKVVWYCTCQDRASQGIEHRLSVPDYIFSSPHAEIQPQDYQHYQIHASILVFFSQRHKTLEPLLKSEEVLPSHHFWAGSQHCEKRLLASSYLSILLSVRPHGTTRLPVHGFSSYFIKPEDFSKTCRENSSFVKI
jgi:hypothetical protein